jgi:hypothetical protein
VRAAAAGDPWSGEKCFTKDEPGQLDRGSTDRVNAALDAQRCQIVGHRSFYSIDNGVGGGLL